ncbi:dipeptide epimerase [Thalassotalea piscium]|uniref:Dipeptide epimerase n=1 Tax=Thalassotalea piscium TaxID=1230533 RepID=A0A7X0NFC8_9GAMM|nr:dipeptide epimerase [Thalassotalea piscium]MBB6542419.1 o-succinylbenzoate synthase [Thalassotalea piscium]
MKITNIRFAKLIVPLITPFKTSMRTVENIEDLVVIVETDAGEVGYGASPATPVITGDTHGAIIAAIDTVLLPKLKGMDIENLNGIIHVIQSSIINNTSAKAALELAIYDLWGKLYKAPLYQLLGGGDNKLQTDITISVDNIDKMISDSVQAVADGFNILKIKIGTDIKEDIERVKAIHSAVDNDILLRLDVNQGWSAKQTVYAANYFESIGIHLELIEQPVRADDIAGLKYISDRVHTPIMADESAFSPKQVIELITSHCVDIINIKLMKTGGISNAIKIADIAKIYQVECMIGCMLEGSIGVSGAAHLAVAKSDAITKIDLDGPALGQYDPISGGVTFDKSVIQLNNAPGLGINRINGLVDL